MNDTNLRSDPSIALPAAVVTGATEGIGRALAEEFAREVEATNWSVVRWEALRTYYSIAAANHRGVLDEPIRSNAASSGTVAAASGASAAFFSSGINESLPHH